MNIRGEIIYVMGVSGVGKTTIGKMLAERLEIPYREADDFHPQSNVDKMAAGNPLDDDDREPWLIALSQEAILLAEKSGGVITCSALKQKYRDLLEQGLVGKVKWVYLRGEYDLLLKRMTERTDHYMPATLLKSQFDALEEPTDAITVSVHNKPETIVNDIIEKLNCPIQLNE